MNSIGIDAHSARFFLCAVNDRGNLIKSLDREMSPENLIEAVGSVPGPRQVTVEESHLAQFVKSVLEVHADRLIVCDPRHNRWIAEADFCDDRTAARKLALLLHRDELKEVVHPDNVQAELRSTFMHYHDLNAAIVRCKNKVKGVFRSVGIRAPGRRVYGSARREWLDKLRSWRHLLVEVRQHYEVLDVLLKQKVATCRLMVRLAAREPAFALLRTIPGVGPVLAAGYVALIGSAHRFSHKNKLWSYAGFGNVLHTSDARTYKSGCSSNGNRVLKWVVLQHFRHVMRIKKSNYLNRKYKQMLASGHSETASRRATCRLLLSVVRRMWIDSREYREEGL